MRSLIEIQQRDANVGLRCDHLLLVAWSAVGERTGKTLRIASILLNTELDEIYPSEFFMRNLPEDV